MCGLVWPLRHRLDDFSADVTGMRLHGYRRVRVTVTGEKCEFPATWQGETVNDCVPYLGKMICPVVRPIDE